MKCRSGRGHGGVEEGLQLAAGCLQQVAGRRPILPVRYAAEMRIPAETPHGFRLEVFSRANGDRGDTGHLGANGALGTICAGVDASDTTERRAVAVSSLVAVDVRGMVEFSPRPVEVRSDWVVRCDPANRQP